MKPAMTNIFIMISTILILGGCASYNSQVVFPSPDDVFVTTGDGNIQKPYTPVGQLIYMRSGMRLSFLPIIGMIPFNDVDPSMELKREVFRQVREMGGDALINLKIDWKPPTSGFLGLFSDGGNITIYGTVIKR